MHLPQMGKGRVIILTHNNISQFFLPNLVCNYESSVTSQNSFCKPNWLCCDMGSGSKNVHINWCGSSNQSVFGLQFQWHHESAVVPSPTTLILRLGKGEWIPTGNKNNLQGVSYLCYKDSFANLKPTHFLGKLGILVSKTFRAKLSLWIHIVVLLLISKGNHAMERVENIKNVLQAKKILFRLKHKLKCIAFTICHYFRNVACLMCSRFVIITRLMQVPRFFKSHCSLLPSLVWVSILSLPDITMYQPIKPR